MRSGVCVIAKNEERAIAEWIAYQRVIGFDEILVYDNGSHDRTREIVEHIARHDRAISYIAWPDLPEQAPQITAYQDAVQRSRADWLAFFDTDEFLVLKRHRRINDLLSSAPDSISAIAVNWRIFGSAGEIQATTELVIKRFIRCAYRNHPKNRFCKTIARRAAIGRIRVHTMGLLTGGYADSRLRPIVLTNDAKTTFACLQGAQLNHYLLKSWQEFEEKRARGNAARAPDAPDKYSHRGALTEPPRSRREWNADNEFWRTHDLNMRSDRTILALYPAVVTKLVDWGLLDPGRVKAQSSSRLRTAIGGWRSLLRWLQSRLQRQS